MSLDIYEIKLVGNHKKGFEVYMVDAEREVEFCIASKPIALAKLAAFLRGWLKGLDKNEN